MVDPGGQEMPACPECESALDIDTDDVEEGDVIACEECGTEFEVVATDPLQLSQVEEEGYDDEDEELRDEEEE
jgi:alpha-aminoadipate carrier protein LysW